MKTIFPLLLAAIFFAGCGKEGKKTKEQINYESEALSPAGKGRELFEGSGNCFACHKPDQKIIAPSLQEIAKIYKEKNGNMVEFLKGRGEPIVDPSQYEVMQTNFAITRNMSDEDLKSLESYVMSFAK